MLPWFVFYVTTINISETLHLPLWSVWLSLFLVSTHGSRWAVPALNRPWKLPKQSRIPQAIILALVNVLITWCQKPEHYPDLGLHRTSDIIWS